MHRACAPKPLMQAEKVSLELQLELHWLDLHFILFCWLKTELLAMWAREN